MRAINLLPKQAVGARRGGLGSKLPFIGSGLVPVAAVILVFVGYSSGHSVVTAKQAQLTTLNAELAAVKPAAVSVVSTPALDTSGLVAERTQRLAALQTALGYEVAWDTTLLNLARVLPANVWLTSLVVKSPTPADVAPPAPPPVATTSTTSTTTTTTATPPPAPVAPPVGFTIVGSTYSQADVAALLQRLQLLPTLSDVTLVSTTAQPVGKTPVVGFNITASIQPTPSAVTP
jgi:Tfp pilus assembly protein PilN